MYPVLLGFPGPSLDYPALLGYPGPGLDHPALLGYPGPDLDYPALGSLRGSLESSPKDTSGGLREAWNRAKRHSGKPAGSPILSKSDDSGDSDDSGQK